RRSLSLGEVLKAIPRLSPAIDDGEQRQACDARWRPRHVRNRTHLLGRARHQRPALVLSADPSGNTAHSLRFYRLRTNAESVGQTALHAARECRRAGLVAFLRQYTAGNGG